MFDTDHNLFWILVFAIPITSIIMGSLSRMARYRALSKLAEQGKPIPPELMSTREDHSGMVARGTLRGGIVMICIGIGLSIFFFAMTGAGGFTHGVTSNHDVDWLPAIGAIPFMIGVGLVVSAAVERRRPDEPK